MLADTDVLIESFRLHQTVLQAFFLREKPDVSAVTVVEALGYHLITPTDRAEIERYVRGVAILPVTDAIMWRAVALRQARKMGLGDALIAATALEHNLTLATRNTADFRHVSGPTLVDPITP